MAKGEKNYQLGKRIKDLRGLETQVSLASKLNITQGMLSRYEKGTLPDPEILLRIIDVYQVDYHWLLTGEQTTEIPAPKESRHIFSSEPALLYLIDVVKRAFEGMKEEEKDGLVQDVIAIVQKRKTA